MQKLLIVFLFNIMRSSVIVDAITMYKNPICHSYTLFCCNCTVTDLTVPKSSGHACIKHAYGDERYEKREMQIRVRQRFSQLQAHDEKDSSVPWHIVNAAQTVEQVQEDINKIVEETVRQVQEEGKSLELLWQAPNQNENKEN